MDVGLISFVLAQLAVQWNTTGMELSWIASAGFVGMAVGAVLGGLLADRIGRRQVFALTLLVYGVATGASALSGSVAVLIAWRFLVGLGLGAELPVASTLVSEFAPPRIRGRIIVLLESFWAIGWTIAAVIGFLVVPSSENGWRWALAVGAAPALYAVFVRLRLPESVRFLESRGRFVKAESTVCRFELSAKVTVPPPESDPAVQGGVKRKDSTGSFAALWSPSLRGRTAALWLVWFCVNFSYYGAFIWLPTVLVASGFSLVRSFAYTLIITVAQLPGYAASAYLIERWGRRSTLAVFLIGSASSAALFGIATDTSQVIAAGMLLSFFNLGAWGALYAVTPEVYPTRIRATGAGWAAGSGRIAAILAPLAVPLLREAGGTGLLFAVFAGFFVVAALGTFGLPEKRGQALAE
ncbi:MFS transporter [Cryobacterium lyxosi]|uniref:MFS transporter n=2 Tax=Cryobacterium lyxosi TaxID=1259228 RepID=A0A4R8ZGP4_9MICO|nr:MFS transporter [Cryobacterium lyxosi]